MLKETAMEELKNIIFKSTKAEEEQKTEKPQEGQAKKPKMPKRTSTMAMGLGGLLFNYAKDENMPTK